jgi:hypothetical protein
MADLRDVVVYLCKHYPHPQELSKARLTKMVYLADWRSALSEDHQITNITWEFNHYGPYVRDVEQVARQDPDLTLTTTVSYYGAPKDLIAVRPDVREPRLSEEEREILDYVISNTKTLYWSDFINLVYSTYPVRESAKYSHLNLVKLAGEYKAIRRAEAQ